MISVVSQFTFEAAHRLFLYNGDCANIHGHSYRVEVSLMSTVNKEKENERDYPGIAVDFKELKSIVSRHLKDKYDHFLILNQNDPILKVISEYTSRINLFQTNPTAEVMAERLYREIRGLLLRNEIKAELNYVKLWETEHCYVTATSASIEAWS